jgi:hypothetical protein
MTASFPFHQPFPPGANDKKEMEFVGIQKSKKEGRKPKKMEEEALK